MQAFKKLRASYVQRWFQAVDFLPFYLLIGGRLFTLAIESQRWIYVLIAFYITGQEIRTLVTRLKSALIFYHRQPKAFEWRLKLFYLSFGYKHPWRLCADLGVFLYWTILLGFDQAYWEVCYALGWIYALSRFYLWSRTHGLTTTLFPYFVQVVLLWDPLMAWHLPVHSVVLNQVHWAASTLLSRTSNMLSPNVVAYYCIGMAAVMVALGLWKSS